MDRILLLLENKANRALLAGWLGQRYEVIWAEQERPLATSFDLCLLDGATLDRLWQEVLLRKAEDEPTFLPFVLITSHREAELITRHLWRTIDELVRAPIEKLDLQARVEMLLRTRRLSLELRLRNEELESFFHAMTHDLRAPLRAISEFGRLLQTAEGPRLSTQGYQDLTRIQSAAAQMQDLLDGLISFARVEYNNKEFQPVPLVQVLEYCLVQLKDKIEAGQASVTLTGSFPAVQGNKTLLAVAVSNLLSNALKFVAPGVLPRITVQAEIVDGWCRLEVADNGIGIALQDQRRLFAPFVQLHGVERYDGVGLGLATVRKVVEILHGRNGVTSQPGQGSIFWIELRLADKEHYAVSTH